LRPLAFHFLRHNLSNPQGYRIAWGNGTFLRAKENVMSTILVLNSSVSGVTSVSRILVEEAVSRLLEAEPGATVVHRDLGAAPIPHLTTTNLAGVRGVPTTDAELAARSLSNQLIAELRAADTIVIGAPMYNFSIPTGLRAWFDYVLRAENFQLFGGRPEGPARR
jgi:FMN-dependent NADH-azoreductase